MRTSRPRTPVWRSALGKGSGFGANIPRLPAEASDSGFGSFVSWLFSEGDYEDAVREGGSSDEDSEDQTFQTYSVLVIPMSYPNDREEMDYVVAGFPTLEMARE